MLAQHLDPGGRSLYEGDGGEVESRGTRTQGREVGYNESKVVVLRQPAEEPTRLLQPQRASHKHDVVSNVAVAHHHTLGFCRRP